MLADKIKKELSMVLDCLDFYACSEAKEDLSWPIIDESTPEYLQEWIRGHYKVSDEIKEEAERILNKAYNDEDVSYIMDVHERNHGSDASAFNIMMTKLENDLENEHDKRLALRNKIKNFISSDMSTAKSDLSEKRAEDQWHDWNTQNESLLWYMGYPLYMENPQKTFLQIDLNEVLAFIEHSNELDHEMEFSSPFSRTDSRQKTDSIDSANEEEIPF